MAQPHENAPLVDVFHDLVEFEIRQHLLGHRNAAVTELSLLRAINASTLMNAGYQWLDI